MMTQPNDGGNWGPWIEWGGWECTLRDDDMVHVKFRRRVDRHWEAGRFSPAQWAWDGNKPSSGDIIAYRVRLPADDLLRQAVEALRRADEELRMIRMKDTGSVYDTLIRIDIAAVLAAYDKRGK